MKKSRKKAAEHKKSKPINGFAEFFIGFLAASVVAFVLVNMFRNQIYEFLVDVTGL